MVGLVLVAAAVTTTVVAIKSKDNDDKKLTVSDVQSQPAVKAKKACNIFSLAAAKQLLGGTAKGGQNPAIESSADLDVSTCTYTQDAGSNVPVANRQSATLLVRSSKTEKGAVSNRNQFSLVKPADVQDVGGYGEAAYWDTLQAQLDILKNNTWYILTYGAITRADRTLDQTKQLADLLIGKM